MAGGAPEAVGHYAITVVCAAYRRGFHAAATSLTEAAQRGCGIQRHGPAIRRGRTVKARNLPTMECVHLSKHLRRELTDA